MKFFFVAALIAAGCFAAGGAPTPTPTPTPTCPLPANYGVKKKDVISPEQPLEAVCHNGRILCVPRSAAAAHMQKGDKPLGPCSNPGINGPCP